MSHDLVWVAIEGAVVMKPTLKYLSGGTALCKFGVVARPKQYKDGEATKEGLYFTVTCLGRTAETIYPIVKPAMPVRVEGEYHDGIYLDKLTDEPCIGRVVFAQRVKAFVYWRERKISKVTREMHERAEAQKVVDNIGLDNMPF